MARVDNNADPQPETIELEGDEDESLLEEDLGLHRRPRDYHLRRYCNFSIFWWLSNVVMGVVIAYLAFQLDAKNTLLGRFELSGDVNRISPRLGHRGVTFKPDNRYVRNLTSPTFKEDTRDVWIDLLPKGLGLVEVRNPDQHPRLPTPYIKNGKTVYTASVTQQLHCLYRIMHSVNDLTVNKGSFGPAANGESPEYLSYCFDYLRQALMCHGDTALEGLHTTFGPETDGTDGWNTRHVCKPWQRLYNWLDRRRIDDSVWD